MLSAVVITKNEERRIARCLESLKFCDEIVLVDDESTDNTIKIARTYTDKIHTRKLDDFSSQKNYAVSLTKGDWVLSVDADEEVTEELKNSILKSIHGETDSFLVKRRTYIFGRILKFGDQGTEKIIRLFRKKYAQYEGTVHERLITHYHHGELDGLLIHRSTENLEEYFKKMALYISLESVKKSKFKAWLLPPVRFVYIYIFKLGFLDGWRGLLFYLLSSYYYHKKYK